MNKDIYISAVNDIHVDSRLIRETAKKMKEKQTVKSWSFQKTALAACVVLLILATFTVRNIYNIDTKKNLASLTPGKTITLAAGKGKLYINKLEGVRSGKLLVPEGAYSKELTMKELTEYLGKDPLPIIPQGFKSETSTVNIMFKPDGSIFFMTALRYYSDINDPASPSISIQLNKNALPPRDCFYGTGAPKESLIGDTKVVIGSEKVSDFSTDQTKASKSYDIYSTQFIYKGIGYDIVAKKIDGQSFVDLITSIIK